MKEQNNERKQNRSILSRAVTEKNGDSRQKPSVHPDMLDVGNALSSIHMRVGVVSSYNLHFGLPWPLRRIRVLQLRRVFDLDVHAFGDARLHEVADTGKHLLEQEPRGWLFQRSRRIHMYCSSPKQALRTVLGYVHSYVSGICVPRRRKKCKATIRITVLSSPNRMPVSPSRLDPSV